MDKEQILRRIEKLMVEKGVSKYLDDLSMEKERRPR